MKEDYEKRYHDTEQHHWWFKSRRACITNWLKDAPRDSKILDIGCSSGILMDELIAMGFSDENLFGVDISEKAIANARRHGLTNVFVMDAQNITLDHSFDYIISSDCLEHLKDDTRAIVNWHDLLKPGGKLYLFVPAFMSLWSHHDVVNMHFRRYTCKELTSKLIRGNFEVLKSGYWNFFLFLPVLAYRKFSNLFGSKDKNDEGDIVMTNNAINAALSSMINFENRLLRYIRFPFGVSTFCIARK